MPVRSATTQMIEWVGSCRVRCSGERSPQTKNGSPLVVDRLNRPNRSGLVQLRALVVAAPHRRLVAPVVGLAVPLLEALATVEA